MAILKNLIVNGVARVIGDLTASKIIKQGGVSSLFLKADGSVDSTSYYHSGNLTSSVIGNLGTLSNDISGNAATASSVDWTGVKNRPTSLPANGGNADTVDGKHASDFYQYKYVRSNQDSIYDLRLNYGKYNKGDYSGTYKDEYPTYYGRYLALTSRDKNGGALMFFDTPTNNKLGHIYVRTRGAGDNNTTYSEWGTLAYLTDKVASATYAESAGSIDWSRVTNKPNYAAGDSVGGSANYLRWERASSSSSARKIPISWNNDTETTAQRFRAVYSDSLTYRTDTNTISSNISGNAATATSALDADKLDGYHATYANNKPWGTIPVITTSGFMDIGKHLEFHYDNTTGSDFSTYLGCTGNYGNVVYLPSSSGTLALTSQIPTSLPANGGNADYATSAGSASSASKWSTSRKITLTGSVTGSVSIDGSGDVSLATTTNHTHTKSEITDFPTIPSYSTATSDTLGLVKIGYTANGKNYPVLLSNGQMYVNVPWTDTNTNTWRPITDSYSGTSSDTSLSQKGGKAIYDALINGYATSAGSSTYSNTLEVLDVRGSDIIPSEFDSRRITGWFNESTGLLNGNWCSGITVKGWYDGYSSWLLAGYSSTDFGSHGLFFREAANDSGWRDWIQVITSDNISSLTVAIANLARTLSLDGTIKLYALNNNQLNFGGTNTSTTIYFGYQTTDSRAIPTDFIFGGSNGSAKITASGFVKKGINDNNVLLGGGGHKALSLFVLTSGDQSISGTKTFTGTIKANRAESTTGFFLTSDIRKKNIIGNIDIDKCYSLLESCNTILYNLKDDEEHRQLIGLIAQEVKQYFPEIVSESEDGYTLDYTKLSVICLRLLKDLNERIKILENG